MKALQVIIGAVIVFLLPLVILALVGVLAISALIGLFFSKKKAEEPSLFEDEKDES